MFSGPSTTDEHRQSRVHKTYSFPRSQSISVKKIASRVTNQITAFAIVYYFDSTNHI